MITCWRHGRLLVWRRKKRIINSHRNYVMCDTSSAVSFYANFIFSPHTSMPLTETNGCDKTETFHIKLVSGTVLHLSLPFVPPTHAVGERECTSMHCALNLWERCSFCGVVLTRPSLRKLCLFCTIRFYSGELELCLSLKKFTHLRNENS